ncbi:TPR repeat containing protein [Beggiatoa sp. PS]|nr:TPR repeat containing protein [Beggiatoa sp. PS]
MKPMFLKKLPYQTNPLLFLTLIFSLLYSLNVASAQPSQNAVPAFQHGHYEQALELWQSALTTASDTNQRLELLFNIAVAYRHLGMYDQALKTLETALSMAPKNTAIHTLWLNELSQLHLSQGKKGFETAKKTAESARELARKINHPQILATVLRHWGNILSAEENYEEALKTYTEALTLVTPLLSKTHLPASSFSQQKIGNIVPVAIGNTQELYGKLLTNKAQTTFLLDIDSINEYDEAKEAFSTSIETLEQALKATQNWPDAFSESFALIALGQLAHEIQTQVKTPWAQLTNLAYQALNQARLIAERINNEQAKTYAYGYLGKLYEIANRYNEALTLTRQALFASQKINDEVALYHWWRQLGHIHQATGNIHEAVIALRQAVNQINHPLTREKIVTMGYIMGTFRERISPVYFELADLLLQQAKTTQTATQRHKLSQEARETMEFFKQAELQDYFQSECISLQTECTPLEQAMDTQTAVFYPIAFEDRLEILLSLPHAKELTQISVPVGEKVLRKSIAFFLSPLRRHPESYVRSKEQESSDEEEIFCQPSQWRGLPSTEAPTQAQAFLEPAQKLYQWLIQPIKETLTAHNIKTLIIVPEGVLRTMPFSALHDGQQFLIENYALAITPGLCFGKLSKWKRDINNMLVSGLSEEVQGFSSLPCAEYEVNTLQKRHNLQDAKHIPLFNKSFTYPNIRQKIDQTNYSILHIASHGQFKSDLEDTFLLTYNDKLSMNRLERIVRGTALQEKNVELLTLSACQTAVGNDRAALGLAGVALKAGVKSALASLWKVDDAATPAMILEFYKQLQNPNISKAQALQIAQKMMLNDEKYILFQHPYYWSAFLLIGNWL